MRSDTEQQDFDYIMGVIVVKTKILPQSKHIDKDMQVAHSCELAIYPGCTPPITLSLG